MSIWRVSIWRVGFGPPSKLNRGIFWIFFFPMHYIQHCFICRPSDSTVTEDAWIEPRTVATSALALTYALTIRLDLIPSKLYGFTTPKQETYQRGSDWPARVPARSWDWTGSRQEPGGGQGRPPPAPAGGRRGRRASPGSARPAVGTVAPPAVVAGIARLRDTPGCRPHVAAAGLRLQSQALRAQNTAQACWC